MVEEILNEMVDKKKKTYYEIASLGLKDFICYLKFTKNQKSGASQEKSLKEDP